MSNLVYQSLSVDQEQGRSHHFKSVCGGGDVCVIPVFSVNPCLIDRFYF